MVYRKSRGRMTFGSSWHKEHIRYRGITFERSNTPGVFHFTLARQSVGRPTGHHTGERTGEKISRHNSQWRHTGTPKGYRSCFSLLPRPGCSGRLTSYPYLCRNQRRQFRGRKQFRGDRRYQSHAETFYPHTH